MLIPSLVFGLAAILCAIMTPPLRKLAIKCGHIDNPDGDRKLHAKPIPLAGGVAIRLIYQFTDCDSCHGMVAH